MDDQLDNDLKNRIKEVFDNFEDASADEGWLLLREKYPEKAKRRAIAWIWMGSAAALLLLFLGVLWLNYTPKTKTPLAINKKLPIENSIPKIVEHKKDHKSTDSSAVSEQNQTIAKNTHHSDTSSKNLPGRLPNHQSQALAANTRTGLRSKKSTAGLSQEQNQPIAVNNKQPVSPAIVNLPGKSNKQELSAISNNPVKVPDNATTPLIASNTPKAQNQTPITPKTANAAKIDTGNKAPAKSMAVVTKPDVNANPGIDMLQVTKTNKALLTENNVQSEDAEKKPKNTGKAVRFGVYAATYFNYAKGSSNQLNVGAGVTSDIRLNDNLKISTGVTIAQNTLNYTGQPPTNSSSLDAASLGISIGHSNTPGAFAAQGIYVSPSPTLKNYNASLVGLDIPIDFTYVFNPKKSDTYISAGLSSGTFINESYTYSYNYSSVLSSNVNQVQDQSNRSSFNSFYFAKTLNVAFGVGYPLGKNRLIIEPFVKYPLDGLGTQQIRFGAGGLNLKFNFKDH